MDKTKKVFRSRISVLFSVLVFVPLISVSIPMFLHKIYIGMFILGGCFLFIILLFTGMRYIISDNKLYLKMWFIQHGIVNIANIVSVKRSYNPLSSPAASLKRLRIMFANNSFGWLISPVKEKEFIKALKAVNPDIKVNIPDKKGVWRIWDWDL